MNKKALLLIFLALGCALAWGQVIISGIAPNPTGTDTNNEYVQLTATQTIDFSVTNYSVVFLNNGTATVNGWKNGLNISYGFNLSSGVVNRGDVFYVGGSAKVINGAGSLDISGQTWIRAIATSTQAGDAFGSNNSSGVFGNGGANADGVGVFNCAASDIIATTVPVDAMFFGTAVGSAYNSGTGAGYTVPTNDHYTTGSLFGATGNTFVLPDVSTAGTYLKLSGSYNTSTNTWTTPRTNIATANPATLADIACQIQLTTSGTPSLTPNPTTITFPGQVAGTTSDYMSYLLTGQFLAPAAGDITVTAPDGFLVCDSATGTYGASCTLPYTGSALSAPVYVKFSPTLVQLYSGSITNNGGGVSAPASVAVTGDSRFTVGAITRQNTVPLSGSSCWFHTTISGGQPPYVAAVYYTVDGGVEQTAPFTLLSGVSYEAVVPSQADGARVTCYVKVSDSAGRSLYTSSTYKFFWGVSEISTAANRIKEADASGVILYPGYYCRVTGVATVSTGVFSTSAISMYIQDDLGGIDIYKASNTYAMTAGHSYTVVGILVNYNGLCELTPDYPAVDITDNGEVGLPTPQNVTMAYYAANREALEGRLIKILGCSKVSGTWPASTSFANSVLTDDSQTTTIEVRVNSVTGGTEPAWPQDVTGIGSQYNTTNQLFPRSPADFATPAGIAETVVSGYTDPINLDNVSISFPGGTTGGTTLYGVQFNETPGIVNTLPASVTNLLDGVYWSISSSAGAVGTYSIIFDFTGVTLPGPFNTIRILKRANDQAEWVDVETLGATYAYAEPYVTVAGLNSFSEFVGGYDAATLPVELTSFTAAQTQSNLVSLTWVTQSETDLLSFKVLRNSQPSLDSAIPVSQPIQPAGSGDSHTYQFTDIDVMMNATYYYWLEWSNISGGSEYRGPVSVTLSETIVPEPVYTDAFKGCYPNPFNPEANIQYSVANEGTPVTLGIYNLRGQCVRTLTQGPSTKGEFKLTWNGTDDRGKSCSTGLYFIRLQIGEKRFIRQISMIK
jgi:hypothetical protein